MTLSVPTFRVLLAGLAASALSVSAISLTAQTTSTPSSKATLNQGPYQPQAQASPFNGSVVEDVVARVNDQIITRSDFQRATQQMDADAKQQGWSEQELDQRKKDLLRDLIDKELLLSKGKELGVTGETELVKRLDEIRKQNHLDSMEDLEKAAQQQGVSYEDFKQNIRNEIISQSVIRDQVSRHVQLTKTDVSNYYNAHRAEFAQPESVHLASILIPVDGDNAESLAQAQAKAAEVETQLKAGTSFEDLAKKDSSGPTASTGGDLGDFKRGALPKPLEDATFDLKAGGVTQPIRTKQGMLIMKVTQHTGGDAQDFATIEPQVEEAAFMTRMQPALRAYLTTLREQAYIDVRPGFQDAGVAANSVKPHIGYSAYVQPGKKKEKKPVHRTRFNESRHTFRSKSGSTQQTASKSATAAGPGVNTAAAAPVNTTTPATATPEATTGTATASATAATASKSNSQVASNTPSGKPIKKQKVRFGQAPTGTLDNAPGNSTPAVKETPAETEVASNVSSNITGSGIDGLATTTAKKQKTRFSARAGEAKAKKGPTQDQLENESQGQASSEEKATQQTQAAPLGLGGDTVTKKKQAKVKSDQKTRFADKPKAATDKNADGTPATDSNAGAAATSATTPEAGAPATNSAPPASTPDEKAPLDTTPTEPGTTAPAAPNTPTTSPQ